MHILFTGGGTAGSITSLLPIVAEIKKKDPAARLSWLAPKGSLGRELVLERGISWQEITTTKLRRYFTWRHLIMPVEIILSFIEAGIKLFVLPAVDVVITAGSFVSPPVVWWAWLLRKKIIVIQLDVAVGLANKLMIPLATKVFVAWPELTEQIKGGEFIGLPRPLDIDAPGTDKTKTLDLSRPTVLVVGGGTGAATLNKLVFSAAAKITNFANLVHITGRGKGNKMIKMNNYYQFEFLNKDFISWLKVADIIVSRAGMGAISDFIYLKKAVVLIPMTSTHQELNAKYLADKKAVMLWSAQELTPASLTDRLKKIGSDIASLNSYKNNLAKLAAPQSASKVASYIYGD